MQPGARYPGEFAIGTNDEVLFYDSSEFMAVV